MHKKEKSRVVAFLFQLIILLLNVIERKKILVAHEAFRVNDVEV